MQKNYSLKCPRAGGQAFGFECWYAPPSTSGLLLIGANSLSTPVRIFGADFWVDPFSLIVPVAISSDVNGVGKVMMPIPGGAKGVKLFAQAIWANTPSCSGRGLLSASDALEVEIQ